MQFITIIIIMIIIIIIIIGQLAIIMLETKSCRILALTYPTKCDLT